LAISFTTQKKEAVHLSHLLNNNYGQSKTPGLIFENRCSALAKWNGRKAAAGISTKLIGSA
jgi:hypothetical protein